MPSVKELSKTKKAAPKKAAEKSAETNNRTIGFLNLTLTNDEGARLPMNGIRFFPDNEEYPNPVLMELVEAARLNGGSYTFTADIRMQLDKTYPGIVPKQKQSVMAFLAS